MLVACGGLGARGGCGPWWSWPMVVLGPVVVLGPMVVVARGGCGPWWSWGRWWQHTWPVPHAGLVSMPGNDPATLGLFPLVTYLFSEIKRDVFRRVFSLGFSVPGDVLSLKQNVGFLGTC